MKILLGHHCLCSRVVVAWNASNSKIHHVRKCYLYVYTVVDPIYDDKVLNWKSYCYMVTAL